MGFLNLLSRMLDGNSKKSKKRSRVPISNRIKTSTPRGISRNYHNFNGCKLSPIYQLNTLNMRSHKPVKRAGRSCALTVHSIHRFVIMFIILNRIINLINDNIIIYHAFRMDIISK